MKTKAAAARLAAAGRMIMLRSLHTIPTPDDLVTIVRKPGEPDWVESEIPFGKAHRSRALPGFALNFKRLKRDWNEKYGRKRT